MVRKMILVVSIVLVIVIIAAAAYSLSLSPKKSLNLYTEQGVCNYIAGLPYNYPASACTPNQCTAVDEGNYWNVTVSCPHANLSLTWSASISKSNGNVSNLRETN